MTSLTSANGRSRIVIVSTVFRKSGCEPVQRSKRQKCFFVLKCGCSEIMVLAHFGSSTSRSESSVASHLGPKRKRPRHLALVCEGSAGWHDGAGEMGRRPEHSFYSGSGYCGRLCHHPHVHIIVPGGGISLDGQRWISCRPGFFLPVRVLSRLFRRLFLEQLSAAHFAGQLQFFGNQAALADPKTLKDHLAPLRRAEWVVYAKRPFGGPEAVLAYLSRYTHRVAIANSRLVAFDDSGVIFKWKDYRAKQHQRGKLMTLAVDEFIRRFLIHVLPNGFHRIRHYGLFANGGRADNIARARQLLQVSEPPQQPDDTDCADGGEVQPSSYPCPCCGGRMIVIETFKRGCTPHHRPTQRIRIDRLMTAATNTQRSRLADIGGRSHARNRSAWLAIIVPGSAALMRPLTWGANASAWSSCQADHYPLSPCRTSNTRLPISRDDQIAIGPPPAPLPTSPRFPPSSLIGRPGRLPSGLFVRAVSAGVRGVR